MYNIYDKLWGDDITNSLIWIFIRTGQEMFSEKMWNFKMSQLPYFLSDPIFIIFAPICGEIFTLSFEIMLILDWTSPLKCNSVSLHGLKTSRLISTNQNQAFRNFLCRRAQLTKTGLCFSHLYHKLTVLHVY